MHPLLAVAATPLDRLEGRRLTVLLHGYGADERDLLPVAPAVGVDAVVSLRGPFDIGPGAAWALGPPEVVLSGAGLDLAADAVLARIDELVARHGAPSAVRLLGFSQGGALALTVLRRRPAAIERTALLAAFVPVGAEPGDAELARIRPPVLWVRGDADPVIPAAAIARTAAWLPAHADATELVLPGLGHAIDRRALKAVSDFFR